jgi:hypothetical protein
MTTTYSRGNLIPLEFRIWTTAQGDRQYWKLLEDGRPDPSVKPFAGPSEIDLVHRLPGAGEYRLIANPRGRPATGFNRKDWFQAHDADRNQSAERKKADRDRKRKAYKKR